MERIKPNRESLFKRRLLRDDKTDEQIKEQFENFLDQVTPTEVPRPESEPEGDILEDGLKNDLDIINFRLDSMEGLLIQIFEMLSRSSEFLADKERSMRQQKKAQRAARISDMYKNCNTFNL